MWGDAMPVDFSNVKEVTIPQGACNSISVNGTVIWKREVPIGYTKLDYITASGSQYIETNIIVGNTSVVDAKFTFTNNAGNVFGSYVSTSSNNNFSFYGGSSSSDGYIRYDGQLVRAFRPTSGTIYTLTMGSNGFVANGTSYATFTSSSFTCSTGFWIGMLPNSTAASFKGKIYYLKITDGNTVVADFVPAQRDSDSKKGLYDRISDTF